MNARRHSFVLWMACAALTSLCAEAPGQTADLRLIALPAATSGDLSPNLPTSQPAFAIGSTIYVEIWGQTFSPAGLSSISADAEYDAGITPAIAVIHTATFDTLTSGSINGGSGLVDDLSGSHLGPCTDAIGTAPNWARLAVLEFEAQQLGQSLISLHPTANAALGTAVCGAGDLPQEQIAYGSTLVHVLNAGIPAVSHWGVLILCLLLGIAGTLAAPRRSRPAES